MLAVRKNREKLLIELYEARLEERDRLVRILAEQVEYLRAQLHLPTSTVGQALVSPSTADPEQEVPMELIPAFGGDDRDELEAMRQAGLISEEEYERSLATLTSGANIIE